MLRIIEVKHLIEDPIFVIKDNTIDGVGDDSMVNRTKFGVKFQVNSHARLAKSKLLVEPGFGMGFLTSRARLTFA